MTTLYITVDDEKAEFLKKILQEMACVKSIEEYNTSENEIDKSNKKDNGEDL